MITAKEAMEKAKEFSLRYGDIVIIQCLEMDDSYVFCTNLPDTEDIVPDMPVIQVSKYTREATLMFPDQPYIDKQTGEWVNPLENAKELELDSL